MPILSFLLLIWLFYIKIVIIIFTLLAYEDALNYKKDSELTNEGFTRERSVDGEVSLNRSTGKQNGRFEPTSITIENTVPSSFVNPAFDKDDISDEDLDSSMAKPTPNRPRTLGKGPFFKAFL